MQRGKLTEQSIVDWIVQYMKARTESRDFNATKKDSTVKTGVLSWRQKEASSSKGSPARLRLPAIAVASRQHLLPPKSHQVSPLHGKQRMLRHKQPSAAFQAVEARTMRSCLICLSRLHRSFVVWCCFVVFPVFLMIGRMMS